MRLVPVLVLVLAIAASAIASADDMPPAANGADDIAKAVVRELASLKAVNGVAHTVAAISATKPANLAKRTTELKAALTKASVKVVDDFVEDGTTYLTVEAATGGRARIELGPTAGEIWVMPAAVKTKAPGRCVAVPVVKHPVYMNSHAIDQSGEDRRGQTYWGLQTRRLADVDGDAVLDAFVPVAKRAADCPEKVSYRVYAMRGACGHDLGVVGPGAPGRNTNVVPVGASGWKPITTSATQTVYKTPIPDSITTTRTFEVKAGKYAETAKQTSGGKCHHCASWSCVAAPANP